MDVAEGSAWQQAEPVRHQGGLTVFKGSTFVLCDAAGELVAEPDGFFVADRRVLSRLVIGIDGWQSDVLRTTGGGDAPAHVLRRAISPDEPPGIAPLLLASTLEVEAGELTLRLLVRNPAPVRRTARLRVLAAADFADIFAVKEGRAAGLVHHEAALDGGRLLVRGQGTTTVLDLGPDPVDAVVSGFADDVALAPRGPYERTVVVTAHVEGAQLGADRDPAAARRAGEILGRRAWRCARRPRRRRLALGGQLVAHLDVHAAEGRKRFHLTMVRLTQFASAL